jgi:hypothetical protein
MLISVGHDTVLGSHSKGRTPAWCAQRRRLSPLAGGKVLTKLTVLTQIPFFSFANLPQAGARVLFAAISMDPPLAARARFAVRT